MKHINLLLLDYSITVNFDKACTICIIKAAIRNVKKKDKFSQFFSREKFSGKLSLVEDSVEGNRTQEFILLLS